MKREIWVGVSATRIYSELEAGTSRSPTQPEVMRQTSRSMNLNARLNRTALSPTYRPNSLSNDRVYQRHILQIVCELVQARGERAMAAATMLAASMPKWR